MSPKISGSASPPTPQQTSEVASTPTPPSTESTKTSTTPATSSQPAQITQQTEAAKDHAISKVEEMHLKQSVRGLEQKQTKGQQIASIAKEAKKSGLEEAQVEKLKSRLEGLEGAAFRSEASFLKNHVVGSPNADRAFRTYNELKTLQDGDKKGRLQNEHIRVLTRGVAERRTIRSRGKEGVLGQEQAVKAGKALIHMRKGDHVRLNKLLNNAGKGADGKTIHGSNPQMEKALILKAVAAREESLSKPSKGEKMRSLAGKPTSHMAEVQKYAGDIRGMQKRELATKSTSIDPYSGNKALQQRWNDSCGPTTAQGIKANYDPVYALKLHKEFIHGTNTGGAIASEQKTVLQAQGGVAVQRGAAGGAGVPGSKLWNATISKYTGVNYSGTGIPDTVQARNAALDDAATKLKKGTDIPIRAGWPGGGGHFMFLTDVRGSGPNQKFLLTDPWKGTTSWITRQELASGNTNFPAGTGRLTHLY